MCFAFLSWLLRDSSSFVRAPASLDPSSYLLCSCFFVLASLGQPFVLLGSRLPWVSPHPLCAFVFFVLASLGRRYFVRFPGSLGPSPPLVCFAFLSWLLSDSSSFVRVPVSLDPSPSLLCFCFSVLASLGQSFVLLGTLGLSPPLVCFCFSVVASPGRRYFC